MAVVDLIDQAIEEGVIFMLDGPRVGLRGVTAVLSKWAPRLRVHRGEVLKEVQKRLAGLHRLWVIRPPRRAAFTAACPQGATEREVLGVWPGAIVEPIP